MILFWAWNRVIFTCFVLLVNRRQRRLVGGMSTGLFDAAAGRVSRCSFCLMSPWIIEGARLALQPRGTDPSGGHVPGLCEEARSSTRTIASWPTASCRKEPLADSQLLRAERCDSGFARLTDGTIRAQCFEAEFARGAEAIQHAEHWLRLFRFETDGRVAKFGDMNGFDRHSCEGWIAEDRRRERRCGICIGNRGA